MSTVQPRAHVALDRADGPVRVGDGLALGHFADEHLAGLGEADHGRRGAPALGVRDDDGLAALQHGDHRVGGPEIDTYGLGHVIASYSPALCGPGLCCCFLVWCCCSGLPAPPGALDSCDPPCGGCRRPGLRTVPVAWPLSPRDNYSKLECLVASFLDNSCDFWSSGGRDTLDPCPSSSSSATVSRSGTPRTSSPAGTTSTSPPWARRRRGPPARCWRPTPDLDLRVVHTSVLTRAIRTADLALDAAGRPWLPVRRHWRLNERHYGALQGLEQEGDHGQARRGPGEGVAPQLRHPAAAGRAGRRPRPGGRPPLPRRARRRRCR